MALIIQKFGGSSVATLDCIRHVAGKVKATHDAGHQVIVVVSAMQGETDRLDTMARQLVSMPHPREMDMLLATGEQAAVALLAMALQEIGCLAKSYTGQQAGISTNHQHTRARIEKIEDTRLRADLKQGYIVVVAGFQGADSHGDITTLGRGGSDTTAVAIAAALKAEECQIYTDVDGVYTTDPRLVPEARKMERVTFEEMLELSSLGAKVLQIRSVEFAGKYNVPVRVLSTFKEGSGTLITFEQKGMEQPVVSGVAFSRDEAGAYQ
jgi:aspartate kinase